MMIKYKIIGWYHMMIFIEGTIELIVGGRCSIF